jgi:uncharacterized membrane protein YfcA
MWMVIPLALAALATSAVSGMLGMAGGILLLAVMFAFLDHAQAIPVHACVQLVSNSTRLLAFFRQIDWPAVGRFVAGAAPGAVIGGIIYYYLGTPPEAEPYLKMIVGLYVLTVTFLPKPKKREDERTLKGFAGIGVVAGAAALTVGAVGPLIAPIFARCGFVKERLVATKAVCQAILHVGKLPVFIIAGSMGKFAAFDFQQLGLLVLIMCAMVIPGTLIGKRLLKGVSDDLFRKLYTVALVAAGLKVFLYDGVWPLLSN